MSKIKAVLIADDFPYGSASANLLRLFTFSLQSEVVDIQVWLPWGATPINIKNYPISKRDSINSIKFVRLGLLRHPKSMIGKGIDLILGYTLVLFSFFKFRIKNKRSLIILYDVTFISLIYYLILTKITSQKILIILPEFYEKPRNNSTLISLVKYYNFYFGIKHLAKYCHSFIVLTSYIEAYIKSRLNQEKPIFIMPNLTDPDNYINKYSKPFKSGVKTIGYIGTPTNKDGIYDLIESFSILQKKHNKTHLLIIGDITNGNTVIPHLKAFAMKCGINNNHITFTGIISHNETPTLLQSCDILALTRPNGVFAEAGFPTKLGEYFACKKPVVVTKVGDIKRYFTDKTEVVLADPNNVSSIVDCFEYLINNPVLAEQIGLAGYKWMEENLNYRNKSKKITEFVLQQF